nr:MAG TPA: hypothetical protein [Caudoviricetes sp.]
MASSSKTPCGVTLACVARAPQRLRRRSSPTIRLLECSIRDQSHRNKHCQQRNYNKDYSLQSRQMPRHDPLLQGREV